MQIYNFLLNNQNKKECRFSAPFWRKDRNYILSEHFILLSYAFVVFRRKQLKPCKFRRLFTAHLKQWGTTKRMAFISLEKSYFPFLSWPGRVVKVDWLKYYNFSRRYTASRLDT